MNAVSSAENCSIFWYTYQYRVKFTNVGVHFDGIFYSSLLAWRVLSWIEGLNKANNSAAEEFFLKNAVRIPCCFLLGH